MRKIGILVAMTAYVVTIGSTNLTTLQPETAIAATTIVVASAADGDLAALAGNGTYDLREAIIAANTNSAVDVCPAGTLGTSA